MIEKLFKMSEKVKLYFSIYKVYLFLYYKIQDSFNSRVRNETMLQIKEKI